MDSLAIWLYFVNKIVHRHDLNRGQINDVYKCKKYVNFFPLNLNA